MSFFGDPDEGFVRGSAGPRTGFFEGVTSGYNQQYVVDSEFALEAELYERWKETVDLLEKRTGQPTTRFSPDQLVSYRRAQQGEDVTTREDIAPLGFLGTFFTGATGIAQRSEEDFAAIRAQSEQLRAAGLPGFEELFAEVQELQRKTEATTDEVGAQGGALTTVGQVIGGIGGSFSRRDPTSLVFGVLGGAGRNAVTRIATEVLAGGTTEAFLQYGPVARNRELAGLPEGNKLANVLLAAGGAAVLGGLLEGGAVALRRFAAAGDSAQPQIDLDFEDAQLRQFIGGLPDSPTARAALDLLDEDSAARQLSPYGTGYQGLRRFTEETAEAELALLGRSDTIAGRITPIDTTLAMREQAEDFLIVREQAPEVAARFDAAEARLAELDAQIDGVTAEVQGRTVLDAVRLVDEDAARELEVLAARTDIPEEAITLEADLIFNRVGKDRILRAAEDAEIAPRKETQRLRKQRKQANKEYRAALRQMETERVRLNTAAQRVKDLMSGEVRDLLGYAIQTKPMRGSALSREVVSEQRALILEGADKLLDNLPQPTLREDGMIEIGDTAIPASFRILDDAGEPVEIAAILRDLDEDERLAEAMRSCSI